MDLSLRKWRAAPWPRWWRPNSPPTSGCTGQSWAPEWSARSPPVGAPSSSTSSSTGEQLRDVTVQAKPRPEQAPVPGGVHRGHRLSRPGSSGTFRWSRRRSSSASRWRGSRRTSWMGRATAATARAPLSVTPSRAVAPAPARRPVRRLRVLRAVPRPGSRRSPDKHSGTGDGSGTGAAGDGRAASPTPTPSSSAASQAPADSGARGRFVYEPSTRRR